MFGLENGPASGAIGRMPRVGRASPLARTIQIHLRYPDHLYGPFFFQKEDLNGIASKPLRMVLYEMRAPLIRSENCFI